MVQAREIIWNRFLQCTESHTRLGLKLGTWSFGALMWRAVLESTGWKLMSWKSSWSSECDSGASSSSRLQEQQWQTGDCIAELNYSHLYNAQHSLLYPVWFGGRKWGIYLLFGFFHSSMALETGTHSKALESYLSVLQSKNHSAIWWNNLTGDRMSREVTIVPSFISNLI